MREARKFTLRGKETKVYLAEGINDTREYSYGYKEKLFLVIDDALERVMDMTKLSAPYVVVKGGDRNKNMEQVVSILDKALRENMGPDCRFVAIGGGAVCDLTTIAAEAYYGGVKLTLIPSTLIAMADCAIGGRCGITGHGRRSFIMRYYPADEILIDSSLLSSLSVRDMQSGMGEMMKSALISPSSDLLDLLITESRRIRSYDREIVEKLILKSIDVKVGFMLVGEKNPLALECLSFGHRLGFGFIPTDDYMKSYGESVVWGMAKALELGVSLGITDPSFRDKAIQLFNLYQFDIAKRFTDPSKLRAWLSSYLEMMGHMPESILLRGQGRPVKWTLREEDFMKVF